MKRGAQTDMMLELFMRVRDPDRSYTHEEIASFVGCTWQNIYYAEKRAMTKLRKRAELVFPHGTPK